MTRSHFGNVTRLGEGRYRVSVEGPLKPDGKRTRKTKVVRGTRDDAEVELARLRLESGRYEATDITVAQYWETFYEPTLSRLSASTQAGYRRAWKTLVSPMFGMQQMAELKARDIEKKLLTIEKPGEQRNAFKLLRQMFNEAYRDELIDENPFMRRIRLKRMEHYEPEILLLDDVPAWLDAIHGSKWEPILLAMLFGGLRREEACALFWEDFKWDGGICSIRVGKTLTEVNGKLVEGPTKTAESRRTVFLAGWPAERMRELASTGPLAPDANGNRTRPDRVSREYRKMMEGSGAKYVPMKNLRNSYATIMQGLGASDSLISKSLGHTEMQTDYAHYFAANAPAHKANAQMLGDAVFGAISGA